MSFKTLAEEARTDPVLRDLNDLQVEAVINVLALVMHADDEVRAMEETEFRQILDELPWLESDTGLMEEITDRALARVKRSGDEIGARIILRDTATQLGSDDVREKVFKMAATLAWADMELHPDETMVLQWLAAALGIDYAQARSIVVEGKVK